MKWTKYIIVTFVTILVFWGLSFDVVRATLIGSGWKDSGSFLGVKVGSNERDVIEQFRNKKFTRIDLDELYPGRVGNGCLGKNFPNDYDLLFFKDTRWNPGVICIVLQNSEVVTFGWDYSSF